MEFTRIKNTRADGDLTQKEIAQMLGCHVVTYRRYENGWYDFHSEMIVKLSAFYNFSCDYLLGLSNEKGKFAGVECTICDRLLALRKKYKLTQQDVSQIISCKRQVYGTYETGSKETPLDVIIKLADYYHISTDYLLGLNVKK